jgi:hypothetical protein
MEVTMLSFVKRTVIILTILTVAAFAGVIFYSKGRTYENSEEEIGNTAGNIYNGGLFCEQDGKIYFSNDFDGGSLYVMNSDCTNLRKLSADKAVYINVDENYIYYVRANDPSENNAGEAFLFNNTGVYRIFQNGTKLKAITGAPSSNLILKGNVIYFRSYDVENGIDLYKYNIDGSKQRLLVKDNVAPAAVADDNIYYTDYTKGSSIRALSLSSFTENTFYKGNYLYPIFMGDYIYYIDTEKNNRIYRMKKDGSDPELLVDEPCSAYNITNTGKYLYYQITDKKKNSICRINLETMKSDTLLKGKFKQISVTKNYVFFKDLKNEKIYLVSADGSTNINTFNPTADSAQ